MKWGAGAGVNLMMVLDVSGSMEGPKFNEAAKSLVSIFKSNDWKSVCYCTFETHFKTLLTFGVSADVPSTILNSFTDGGTDTPNAVGKIMQILKQHESLDIFLVFATDGEDNYSPDRLREEFIKCYTQRTGQLNTFVAHLPGAKTEDIKKVLCVDLIGTSANSIADIEKIIK